MTKMCVKEILNERWRTSPNVEDVSAHLGERQNFAGSLPKSALSIAPMFTYFIRREDGGPIKIGKTFDILNRLSGMQNASPVTFICIAYIKGDVETLLHDRFHHLCLCGEWFEPGDELFAFIAQHATPANLSKPPLSPDAMKRRRETSGHRFSWQYQKKWREALS